MADPFTLVEIAFYPEYMNHWLRFGMPDANHDLDRRRALALFAPGRLFGYVRWYANEYGTQDWRFLIVETVAQGESLCRISGVRPGGELLLSTTGNTRVKRALLAIDDLEAGGFEPERVSPAYYRHIHNRIATRNPIRPYEELQHAACMASRLGMS